MRPRLNVMISMILMYSLVGCGVQDVERQSVSALQSKVGYYCTVQFRRDALGTAAPIPISPTTNNHNGADTSMTGVLKAVRGDWLVLEVVPANGTQKIERWIPTGSVLLLEWSSSPAK